MAHPAEVGHSRNRLQLLVLILALIASLSGLNAFSQQPPAEHEHSGHEGMTMPMDESVDPAVQARLQAKILADKKESEFNHHLAGALVAVAGSDVKFAKTEPYSARPGH